MTRNPTAFFQSEYQELKNNKIDWVHRRLEGPSDVICKVDGKELMMLCSNNYLGLANHPKLKKAAAVFGPRLPYRRHR